MINAIINGIFNLFKFFVSIFFDPIFELIYDLYPGFGEVFTFVVNMFQNVTFVGGYVLDMINLPKVIYVAIFGSLIFRYMISFGIHSFKIMIKWWTALVP